MASFQSQQENNNVAPSSSLNQNNNIHFENNNNDNLEHHDPSKKPPFFVFRLPPGFSFGEICSAPKAQPQVAISRQDAIAKCLKSGPPLLGLGKQKKSEKNEGEKIEESKTNVTDGDTGAKNNGNDGDGVNEPLLMQLQTSDGMCSIVSSSSSASDQQGANKKLLKEDSHNGNSNDKRNSKIKIYSSSSDESKHGQNEKRKPILEPPPSIQYHILHTGNFVRVATMPGRLYWLVQNATTHQSPDWKLHIACQPSDVAIVWNLVVLPVFFEHPTIATVGMKAVLTATRDEETGEFTSITTGEEHWPKEQTGRELTIYLFVDDPMYDENLIGEQLNPEDMMNNYGDEDANDTASDKCESNNDDDDDEGSNNNKNKKERKRPSFDKNHLWVGDDPQISDYWRVLLRRASNYSSADLIHLVEAIQQRMDVYNLPTRGCADGDLPLTRSVSIRNEAYTCGHDVHERNSQKEKRDQVVCSRPKDTTLMYPMNDWGWNAADQAIPSALTELIDQFNHERVVEFSFDAKSALSKKRGLGACCM